MFKKLKTNGIDVMESHEILEILLFNANKRSNTNPLAHDLINKFGSISEVIKASESELLSVKGVGNATVQLILSVRATVDRMLKENIKIGEKLKETDKIKEYCAGLFKTVDREEVRVIFLDNEFRFVSQDLLGVGTTNAVFMDTFALINKIAEKRCTIVIITHNHPRGTEIPSQEDRQITRNLFNVLDKSGVYLADHVIVGMDGIYSMAENKICPDLWG
ncbi:MAG: DNA repair protein [Eubacterium sp.]|nr:DNA repair protein [Eubacterium sp.]